MNTAAALLAAALAVAAFAGVAAPAAPADKIGGEVLETQDVEGYTYLRLKTPTGPLWAAVPTTALKKGAQVTIAHPTVMLNFRSTTLKKTFERIVFGEIASGGTASTPAHATRPAATPAEPGPKVAKAGGPEAKTVAEVVVGRATLKDKTVLVRGRVVKASLGILGRNWLHLRDGSGSPVDGSHDLVVTTTDPAAVGDVVSARGTVRTDVTIGPGYAFAVLVERASLSR